MTRLPVFLLCFALVSCGGGSAPSGSTVPTSGISGVAATGSTPSGSTVPTSSISGVAATGSAIAGRIFLKDAAAHEVFVDTTDGSYTFQTTSLTPPFMLKAEWTADGSTQKLYSFAPSQGTVNITPLTQMAVATAAATDTLDPIYAAPDPVRFVSISNALPNAVSDLKKSLAPLFAKYSVANIDPLNGKFAPDHTGMDALLDNIVVSYASGNVTVKDKSSGAVILNAPADSLSHALSVPDWSAQDAAVATDPDVAVDGSGKGLVVWSELVNSHYVIRSRFLIGTGASATTLSASGDASVPRVAFDTYGNAIVVWAQSDNSRNDIWARRYLAASQTWENAVHISAVNAASDSYAPDIGVDSAGNAVVTWYQGDGRNNHFDVWAVSFNAADGSWTVPALVSDGVNSAYGSHVALNAAGQGIVAWVQVQGDGTTISNGPQDIFGRTVTRAGTWGTSIKLNAVGGTVDSVYGQVAVAADSHGNGLALWVQRSGALPYVIQAARYVAGSGWQRSTVITNNVVDESYAPRVAFDAAGNAVAVWMQQSNGTQYGAANRFDVNSGWGTSVNFTSATQGDVYDPRVAVDADGTATAVWYQLEQSGVNIRTARYTTAGGWGAASILSATSTDGFSTYPVPRIVANAVQTLVIWGIDAY